MLLLLYISVLKTTTREECTSLSKILVVTNSEVPRGIGGCGTKSEPTGQWGLTLMEIRRHRRKINETWVWDWRRSSARRPYS